MAQAQKSSPGVADDTNKTFEGQRIAKVIARSGTASRREAEKMILAGRVAVDGEVITSAALNVTDQQTISIDGNALQSGEPSRIVKFHKPAGCLTTRTDPEGRKTIYDHLPKELHRLMPIGRLDMSSEGLLLLTNDGGIKRHVELPTTGWKRRYRVRAYGFVDEKKLTGLQKGIRVENVNYRGIEAKLESQQGANSWLSVTLTEGKNREIRKVLEALGLTVNRLIRVSFGPFSLGKLPKAMAEEVLGKTIRDQFGRVGGLNLPQSAAHRHKS